jgi:hypothetical protein
MTRPYVVVIWKCLIVILFFAAGYFFSEFEILSLKTRSSSEPATASRQERTQRPPGFWFRRDKGNAHAPPASQPSEEEAEKLAAIGYVDGIHLATQTEGVVVYERALAQPGLNYYTSGHAPEGVLMESSGKVLHTWKLPFAQAFPKRTKANKHLGARYWRRIHLFENGDLLAIYEGLGLIKLDKNSKLLWAYGGNAHHDIDVQFDGEIYVLTRQPRVVAGLNIGQPVWEDFITILDSSGKEKQNISILKALQSSIYSAALGRDRSIPAGDIFHTNRLEVLDGSHESRMPFLKKGNILISICFLDMIAVLDPGSETIVWALSKMWGKQHEPVFLENGNLLVFDNSGVWGKSRVLEIDPLTHQLIWVFEDQGFFSEILGSSQRLPNGNTLITDSDDGRAFEITSKKRKVWEFFNPNRAGSNKEFVAVIPEMVRLQPDFPLHWLK